MGTTKRPIIVRLLEKVEFDTDTGCWMFTGARNSGGYGSIGSGRQGRTVLAHRAAYEALVGPVPEGHQLDHLCRTRACVNPEHLEPVDNRTNVRRGVDARLGSACSAGHEWTAENTYTNKRTGHRQCRACARNRDAGRRARKRARVGE